MIAAIALACSLSDPSVCMSMSSMELFPTVEMCMEDRINAESFALSYNYAVVGFDCFDWGRGV